MIIISMLKISFEEDALVEWFFHFSNFYNHVAKHVLFEYGNHKVQVPGVPQRCTREYHI